MKPFAILFVEILLVLDSPGGCCEAVCTFCLFKYLWFWILQDAVMKPFAHFLFKYLWFWILQDAVVKPFVHFFVELLMVLDSPGGCCEAICKFFLLKY